MHRIADMGPVLAAVPSTLRAAAPCFVAASAGSLVVGARRLLDAERSSAVVQVVSLAPAVSLALFLVGWAEGSLLGLV